MCRLIESIKFVDGNFFRLPLHQARVNKAFKDLFPLNVAFNLTDLLSKQEVPEKGIYKCRIVFDHTPQLIEFVPYTMREIKSLHLVETQIEPLHYKLENREKLNEAFAKRGNCDDIIMLNNGYLSDTWYSNIALWDGKNWCTPTLPIIFGTQRAALLHSEKIIQKNIPKADLNKYSRIRLFNAMIEFGEIELDINSLKY
ncbi:MAG: aminotransferase class IV [Paludibacter sp.]